MRDEKGRFLKGHTFANNSPRNKVATQTYKALEAALNKSNHDWVNNMVEMASGEHVDFSELETKDKIVLQQKAMDMLVKVILKNTPAMVELIDQETEEKSELTPEQRKKLIAQLEAA